MSKAEDLAAKLIIPKQVDDIKGYHQAKKELEKLAFLYGTIGTYLLSGDIMMYQESHKPTAIDVYRGKTTLEITYKDDIAIDSVVTFKDNKK